MFRQQNKNNSKLSVSNTNKPSMFGKSVRVKNFSSPNPLFLYFIDQIKAKKHSTTQKNNIIRTNKNTGQKDILYQIILFQLDENCLKTLMFGSMVLPPVTFSTGYHIEYDIRDHPFFIHCLPFETNDKIFIWLHNIGPNYSQYSQNINIQYIMLKNGLQSVKQCYMLAF